MKNVFTKGDVSFHPSFEVIICKVSEFVNVPNFSRSYYLNYLFSCHNFRIVKNFTLLESFLWMKMGVINIVDGAGRVEVYIAAVAAP